MSYQVEIEEVSDYVSLIVDGEEFELASWVDALSQAVAACRKAEFNKLLIKDLVREDFGFHQMEKLIGELSNLGFADLKTAVFVENHKRQFTNYFGEGIAVRREIQLKVFLTKESAETWLLE